MHPDVFLLLFVKVTNTGIALVSTWRSLVSSSTDTLGGMVRKCALAFVANPHVAEHHGRHGAIEDAARREFVFSIVDKSFKPQKVPRRFRYDKSSSSFPSADTITGMVRQCAFAAVANPHVAEHHGAVEDASYRVLCLLFLKVSSYIRLLHRFRYGILSFLLPSTDTIIGMVHQCAFAAIADRHVAEHHGRHGTLEDAARRGVHCAQRSHLPDEHSRQRGVL